MLFRFFLEGYVMIRAEQPNGLTSYFLVVTLRELDEPMAVELGDDEKSSRLLTIISSNAIPWKSWRGKSTNSCGKGDLCPCPPKLTCNKPSSGIEDLYVGMDHSSS